MRRPPVIALLVAAVMTAPLLAGSFLAAAPAGATTTAPSVALDRATYTAVLGQRFTFTSTIRNDGGQPLPPMTAHLNLLSLDPDVYVDPEDWSADRTRYLRELPAGSATRLTWSLQAVNSGSFVAYVSVSARESADQVTSSPALRLAVTGRRVLNPGGALPLALAVPAAVLLLMGLAGQRRRLRSRPPRAAD